MELFEDISSANSRTLDSEERNRGTRKFYSRLGVLRLCRS
jgi:hypothetical protein